MTVDSAKISTPKTDAAGLSSKGKDLKAKWADLKDVDRASAVHDLHGQGVSFRKLAQQLPCSATQLRNLDKAARASPEDIALARKGEISTRKLVKRSIAAEKLRAAQQQEALAQKKMKAARKAAKMIWDWLEERQLFVTQSEVVIDEARRILAVGTANGNLPKVTAPKGMPLAEIIECTRPKPAKSDPEPLEVDSIGWYAEWLARWVFFGFPDAEIRDRALNIAIL